MTDNEPMLLEELLKTPDNNRKELIREIMSQFSSIGQAVDYFVNANVVKGILINRDFAPEDEYNSNKIYYIQVTFTDRSTACFYFQRPESTFCAYLNDAFYRGLNRSTEGR